MSTTLSPSWIRPGTRSMARTVSPSMSSISQLQLGGLGGEQPLVEDVVRDVIELPVDQRPPQATGNNPGKLVADGEER